MRIEFYFGNQEAFKTHLHELVCDAFDLIPGDCFGDSTVTLGPTLGPFSTVRSRPDRPRHVMKAGVNRTRVYFATVL